MPIYRGLRCNAPACRFVGPVADFYSPGHSGARCPKCSAADPTPCPSATDAPADSPCEFTTRDLDRLMDHVRKRHIASTCGPDGRVIAMRDTVWAELSPDVVQELIVTYLRNRAETPS
jgi:hypothetical protein